MEWLVGSLKELKHEVTVGDTIAPNAMNLIWENFRDADEQIFEDYNFKFGLIATEIPVGDSFNWLDAEPWRTRRRTFDRIAPRAQFIWSLVEEPANLYRRWAPSGYLELGFRESIVDRVFEREPEFDFGYYGLEITSYRGGVLNRLNQKLKIVTPDRFLAGRELNTFISSFKIGICLKHSAHWTIPSPGRTARLLHAKRGIAAEYVPVRTRASALVPMAGEDQDFAEFCLECINGPWRERAEQAFETYRAKMPMKDIMERLLDETVASAAAGQPGLAQTDDGLRQRPLFGGDVPQFLSSERGFNFLAYGGRVYALDQKIGSVDLTRESAKLLQRFGARAVIVARTFDEARERVAALPRR
jgi:hypothetical protein